MRRCELVAVFCLTILSGCDREAATPLRSSADTGQDERLSSLERLVQDNKTKLVAMTESGALTSTASGFTPIASDIGILTFQINEIEPNGSGSDLQIQVGNPTMANISQLQADLTWYSKDADGKWVQRGSSKGITLPGDCAAGTWTTTTVSLSDIKPDEFDYLYVQKVSATSITLGATQ